MDSKRTDNATLISIARRWFPVAPRTRFTQISGGLASFNWKFGYRGKIYLLKKLTRGITKHDILFEYHITNYIRESGFRYAVPLIILSKDGLPFAKAGSNLYSVYEYIKGESGKNINAAYAKEIGAMIADMHSITESYRFGKAKRSSGYHTIEMLKKRFYNSKRLFEGKSDRLSETYMKNYPWFSNKIKKIDLKYYKGLKVYALHEDISPENILWKNGKIIALIDFGNIGRYRNPFLMDLAWAVHFCCKSKPKKCYSMRLISAFFKGYRGKRTITKSDAKALVSLILLVEAATMESSYINALKLVYKERMECVHAHINAAKWLTSNHAKVESAIVG